MRALLIGLSLITGSTLPLAACGDPTQVSDGDGAAQIGVVAELDITPEVAIDDEKGTASSSRLVRAERRAFGVSGGGFAAAARGLFERPLEDHYSPRGERLG
ncbi:hypothetical protein [Enhygromyxa salina]|uniref:hypothetical protein n=1 Tax=Enhygromyxa salina TaxID=215803 RepID=UPI000D08E4E7|nr:hypothetical protein [Enhygromyxa salina]